MPDGSLAIVARRRYPVPREAVFRALSDPQSLARWFSPSEDIGTEVLDFDFRSGGRYRFGFHLPDGRVSVVAGRYRQIVPPATLVFTWTWEAPDPHAGVDTLVTVELREGAGETELTVVHERFPDAETRDRHDEGWAGTLDRLAGFLGAGATAARPGPP
jgi:uncharacterized protein YndB with AHSA1/START domain